MSAPKWMIDLLGSLRGWNIASPSAQRQGGILRILPRLLYSMNRLRWRITRPLTLGVRLLLVKDSSVLLVKHTYTNCWHLVGGGVKRNETVEQAARREAMEEVGAQLGRLSLFGAYSSFGEGKSDHIILFACDDFSTSGKTDREIESCRLFELNNLPDDISPATKRRILEYLNNDETPLCLPW
jgi:8-oxo-dGTP pyrophosphatase MutT (NUDIX family)